METKNIIQHISFSSFDEQRAIRTFNLTQELKVNLFADWEERASHIEPNEEENKRLNQLQTKLKLYVRAWNEEELKLKFIGPVIELVDFDNYELEIISFSERAISATFGKVEIRGVVDMMVASGLFTPEQPFFFIHEYKREQDSSGDPVGQLLSTMFVAQELNKHPQSLSLFKQEVKDFSSIPLAGVYVLGRMWVFIVLIENRYRLSKSYDSTDREDLQYIFKMLKAHKEIIFEMMSSINVS
jgi:hypothetical protein